MKNCDVSRKEIGEPQKAFVEIAQKNSFNLVNLFS